MSHKPLSTPMSVVRLQTDDRNHATPSREGPATSQIECNIAMALSCVALWPWPSDVPNIGSADTQNIRAIRFAKRLQHQRWTNA